MKTLQELDIIKNLIFDKDKNKIINFLARTLSHHDNYDYDN